MFIEYTGNNGLEIPSKPTEARPPYFEDTNAKTKPQVGTLILLKVANFVVELQVLSSKAFRTLLSNRFMEFIESKTFTCSVKISSNTAICNNDKVITITHTHTE